MDRKTGEKDLRDRIRSGKITREDVTLLPKGEKIAKLLRL
jgi:hypothetical protein